MTAAVPTEVTAERGSFRLHSFSQCNKASIPGRNRLDRVPTGSGGNLRRTPMKTIILGMAVSMAMIGGAAAASITNKDSQPQVLIVTEAADKIEMVVEAGATSGAEKSERGGDKPEYDADGNPIRNSDDDDEDGVLFGFYLLCVVSNTLIERKERAL